MTVVSQRLAALPAQRRAEFLARLKAQTEGAVRQGPTPRGNTGPAPLSYAQETLWFLNRLAPNSPTDNVPLCVRLRGDLDVNALRSALAVVVARHEALRTAIVAREDGPVQVVAPEVPVELPLIEAALIEERVKAPFDLSRNPMWRAALVRLAPEDHLFLFHVHHIVFDDWSLGVLSAELAGFYLPLDL